MESADVPSRYFIKNVVLNPKWRPPTVNAVIDSVGEARYVTKLDMWKGYWQVPLSE